MKKKVFFSDFIFLMRPSIMIAVWTFFMGGVYTAMRLSGSSILFNLSSISRILVIMFLYSLLMGSVYIINQIADRDTDRINRKLFLLSDNYISPRSAVIFEIALSVTAIAGIFFMPGVRLSTEMLFILSFVLGYIYSVKPFSLKRRPVLDMLDNMAGYGLIAVIIGYQSTGRVFHLGDIIEIMPFMFSMGAVFINTTLMDYKGDKETGARTTGVFFGFRVSSILAFLFILAALVFAVINSDPVMIIASGISTPLFLIAAFKSNEYWAGFSVKFSSPVLTVILSILYPYFLIINLLTVAGMKIYYKKRFNKDYPF